MPDPRIVGPGSTTCIFTFGAAVVDVSGWTVAVQPSAAAEAIDMGTFANPNAQEVGASKDAVTVALLWGPGLYDALLPYVGVEGTIRWKAKSTDTRWGRGTVKFGALPWGEFRQSQRIEADLVCVVTTGQLTYDSL